MHDYSGDYSTAISEVLICVALLYIKAVCCKYLPLPAFFLTLKTTVFLKPCSITYPIPYINPYNIHYSKKVTAIGA